MIVSPPAARRARLANRLSGAMLAVGLLMAGGQAVAQQQPSAGAMAAAREFIALKGATNIFDPVVPGVIETAKNTFLRMNPQLSKDLNEVAAQLKAEYAAKRAEFADEVARIFARRFTEQELKDAVVFYKTPLGKKLIAEEASALEEGMGRVQELANRFSEDMLTRIRAEMKKRGHTV